MADEINYFAMIPCDVMYNTELPANAKLLYGTISSLTHKEGFCYASNACLAEYYNVTPQAISKWVNLLEDKGFIRIEYIYNGSEVKQRRIFILETFHKASEKNKSKESDEVSTGNEVSTNDEKGINKGLKGYQQKVKVNNINSSKELNNINSSCEQVAEKKQSKAALKKSQSLKKQEEIQSYLNSLSETDSLAFDKCVSVLFEFHKSKIDKFNRSHIQLTEWKFKFAKFSEESSRTSVEILSTLTFAISDSFWSRLMFGPDNLIKNYDKIVFAKANYQPKQQSFSKPSYQKPQKQWTDDHLIL